MMNAPLYSNPLTAQRLSLISLLGSLAGALLSCEEPSSPSPSTPTYTIQLSERQDKVVYGEDSRRDYYQLTLEGDELWRARARYSTGVLVRPSYVSTQGEEVILSGDTLGEARNLCLDENFYSQPEPGFCSGTLISEDLFLTAGHCVDDANDCANTRVVFQYIYTDPQSLNPLTQDDLYQCERIVTRRNSSGYDFAVIRLDRAAASHLEPAPINFADHPVTVADPLTLIGAPNGIPVKVDSGGQVTSVGSTNVTFKGSVDAFGGNSGSAIYDANGEIVGILVQGRPDYYTDEEAGCRRVNHVEVDEQGAPLDGDGTETAVFVRRAVDALCIVEPTHSVCLERDQSGAGPLGGQGGGGGDEPPQCEDDFEPDDSSNLASSVTFGVTQLHTFCDDPTDWLRFTLDQPAQLDLETYRVGVMGAGDPGAPFEALADPLDARAPNTELTLYDESLVVLEVDQDGGDGSLSLLSGSSLGAGTYLVRLRDAVGDGGTDGYAVMIRGRCEEDSQELLPEPYSHHHDDYPSERLPSTPIPSRYTGSLCDEDWRRLEVSEELVSQGLTIRIQTEVQQPTDTVLAVYNSEGIEVAVNDDGAGLGLGSRVEWAPQVAGTYWVRVRGFRHSYNFTRPYILTVSTNEVCDELDNDQDGVVDEGLNGCRTCDPDPYEENDSLAEAVGVGIGYSIPLNHCQDPEDWFSFTLQAEQRVDIETTVSLSSDTVIELYNRQSELIAQNDDINQRNLGSGIYQFIAPYTGGYWLRVRQYNQNIGPNYPYELLIREACADDNLEPDDQATQAALWSATSDTPLSEARSLCDPDWVRFEALAGQRFSFELSALTPTALTLTVSRDFGRIPLASVSDSAGEGLITLEWEAPLTGSYWLSVLSFDGRYGGDASYALSGSVYPSEQCNGQDDDQDGQTDEGVSNDCGGCGPLPQEECDGLDNDCDGRVDEGTLNACGACGPAPTELCDTEDNDCDGRVDEGTFNACGQCGPVPEERCDGLDNDCDESIDEGVLNACGLCGPTPEERCDGEDNDCDAQVDEGLELNACGACGEAPVEACDGEDNDCDGQVDEGLLNACGGCGEPPVESCDGEDNDCDGLVDEGLLNACGACGEAPPERCDGLYQGGDDDCDGVVDEGCELPAAGAEPEGGSSALAGEDAGRSGEEGGGSIEPAGSEPPDDRSQGEGAPNIDEGATHIGASCQGSRGPSGLSGLMWLLILSTLARVRRRLEGL